MDERHLSSIFLFFVRCSSLHVLCLGILLRRHDETHVNTRTSLLCFTGGLFSWLIGMDLSEVRTRQSARKRSPERDTQDKIFCDV